MTKSLTTLFFILLFGLTAFGQMTKYTVKVNMDDGFESMDGAFALIKVNGKQVKRIAATNTGKLEFDLEFGQDYVVEFHKQYYATKKIDVFLKNVSSEMIDIGCKGNTWHVGMIKKIDGIDYSALDQPVGKIFFEPEQKCFDWDADYSLRVMEQLEKLEAEMEAKKKEFDKAMSDAEKALSKGDFEGAKASLATAKSEFPHDERIPKLEEDIAKAEQAAKDAAAAAAAAEEAKKKEEELKAKQDQYDDYMDAGDKALKDENFEEARSNYKKAGEVLPEATAHKTKLQVVDDTEKKRQAEEEAKKLAEEEAKKQAEAEAAAAAAAKAEAEKKAAEEAAAEEARKAEEAAQKEAEKLAEQKAKEEEAAKKEAEKAAQEEAERKEKERIEAEKVAALAAAKNEEERLAAEKAAAEALEKQEKEKQKAAEEEAKQLEEEKKAKEEEAALAAEKAKKDAEEAEKQKAEEDKRKAEEEAEAQQKAEEAKKVAEEKAAKESAEKEKAKKDIEKVEKEGPKKVDAKPVVASATVAHKNAQKKKALHTTAKKVKPKEDHADKLAKLDAAAMAQTPKTTSIHEHHDWNMKEPGVHKKIAQEYPEGVTEEIYMKGNKEITERVVVKDGRGDIFWKVKHPWGGVYYFKNNTISISSVEFDLYTTLKDEEGNIIEPYHIDRVQDHDH